MIVQFLPLAALVLAGAAATWSDVLYRRIPNWLCGVTALAGLASAVLAGGLPDVGSQLLHAVIVLVAGMVLFQLGLFGGGDAKFYAAVATWFPLAKAVLLLISIALTGLVVVMGWFTYRRLRRLPISGKGRTSPFDSLPYGIAIGAGGVVAMATSSGIGL